MDRNDISKNGSTAPTANAVSMSDLWKQAAASLSASNANIQKTAQAQATQEVFEPEAASVHTFGATEMQDAAPTGNATPDDLASRQVNAAAGLANPVSDAVSRMLTAKHPDRTMPLDVRGFPHPPKGSSQYLMPTLENFQHMLQGYEVHVSYDVIKKRLVVLIPDHQGSIDNQESVTLAVINSLATLHGIPIGQIPAMLIALGDRKLRNVAADWIMSRPWDGVDRLPEFYATIQERKGYPPGLKKILLRRWLLSAVAAVLKAHGFHCRGVLVLQGPQGIGKTAFFIALVPDAALRDLVVLLGHHLDGASKDSMTTAITHWIVELGELDGTLKKDIARLKSFVTADTDKIRRPYGRSDSEYQRPTVFGASVNDPNFLVDATGNSRFWTIAVVSINYEHGIDMQQLFAQLAVEFQAGEQWWLTPDEEMQLAEVNKSHRAVSLVRESLMAVIDLERPANGSTKRLTAIETLKEAGIDRPTTGQCKEAATILRELYGDPKKVQGKYVWRVALTNKRAIGGATSPAVDDDDVY